MKVTALLWQRLDFFTRETTNFLTNWKCVIKCSLVSNIKTKINFIAFIDKKLLSSLAELSLFLRKTLDCSISVPISGQCSHWPEMNWINFMEASLAVFHGVSLSWDFPFLNLLDLTWYRMFLIHLNWYSWMVLIFPWQNSKKVIESCFYICHFLTFDSLPFWEQK